MTRLAPDRWAAIVLFAAAAATPLVVRDRNARPTGTPSDDQDASSIVMWERRRTEAT